LSYQRAKNLPAKAHECRINLFFGSYINHNQTGAHTMTTTAPTIEEIRSRIEQEDDVKRIIRLEPHGERFRYLIETPFATFPRFAVGTTDAAGEDVRLEAICGELYTAEVAFAR
jgi:N-acetylglucosamine-6-phosphate deacetylase